MTALRMFETTASRKGVSKVAAEARHHRVVLTSHGGPVANVDSAERVDEDLCRVRETIRSVVELDAAPLLVYRAAWMADEDRKIQNAAFMAKVYATEMVQRVTDRCLRIFGGLGCSSELPIRSFYRQTRPWRFGDGTSEIHRWMIAWNMLGISSRA
jgi:hypothetical protein